MSEAGAQLAVIGGGNMASAIVHGIIDAGVYDPDRIVVADPDESKRSGFARSAATAREAMDALRPDGAVLLAVKPQILPAVAQELAGRNEPPRCVVSILAGMTTQGVASQFGPWARVVRVMPNTPAAIGLGMTAIARGPDEGDIALARKMFEAIGRVVVLDESLMDAFTALAGSGPAYVFLLAEAMSDAAIALGMDEADAALAARQTIVGAAGLLERSPASAGELRRRVTSPGGTTAAAIGAFESGGFAGLVEHALRAARDRGRELGG